MARAGMRDVLLADDGDPEPGDQSAHAHGDQVPALRGEGRAGRSRDVRSTPRHRWLLPAGALALTVTFVVALLVDGVRDRQRAAHLATVPGVLEPMASSLEVVWTQPGGWQHPAVHGPDLMVSLFGDAGEGFHLVANDIVTGDQRWDVALPDMASREDLGCAALGGDTSGVSTHIVCHQVVRAAPWTGQQAHPPETQTRLLVLDARTGELEADRFLDHGFRGVVPVSSDVLVATALADGRFRLRRESPITGEASWTVTSPHPKPGAVASDPEMETEHGLIVVDGPFGMVLSGQGEVLGQWEQPDGIRQAGPDVAPVDVTVLSDTRPVVGSYRASDDPYGTVFPTDLTGGFVIHGPLLRLRIDDGTARDVLLTVPEQAGEIVAVDAQSGEPAWRAAATPRTAALVLNERLITTAGSDLIALDTTTGKRLWTAAGIASDHDLLSDGRVVLVPTDLGSRESALTAFDIADGRALWTVQGPGGVVTFLEIGGRLIGLQQEQMIRLG